MVDPNDLNAFFAQLAQAQGQLESQLGGGLPAEMAAHLQQFQQELPAMKARAEAALAHGKAAQAEQEAYLKRLQGEEVESDKEKEGDLDTAADRFEAEHGRNPEELAGLVQLLRQLVEPEKPPAPNASGRR